MNFLISAVLCSVIVSVFLKIARRNHIDIAQAIAANYIMATALTWFVLKPDLSTINSSDPKAIALFGALGLLLPSVFIIMSKAVERAGIVKSDAAQRLSLFIPIVWALVFFGETLTQARGLGIVLALRRWPACCIKVRVIAAPAARSSTRCYHCSACGSATA